MCVGEAVRRLCKRYAAGALGAAALALAGAGAAAASDGATGAAAAAGTGTPTPKTTESVTLEQCAAAATQVERSATFAAEMTLLPGSTRMEMRIELLERTGKESAYHAVTAPGLGSWRLASAGVRIYRYVKQVTNLAAPAVYRADVHFRWLGAHGRVVRSAERRSASCAQLLPSETGATEAATMAEKPSAAPLA
jgi:hypothetical protein